MKNTRALILIDFINDIVDEKGKMSSCAQFVQENKVIDKANTALDVARAKGYQIIHVKLGHDKNFNTCSKNSPMYNVIKEKNAFILGTWGADFHSGLNMQDNELIVTKHRVSAFYGTDLETILRSNKIEKVMLAGVSTNNAVELTAREAFDRDYGIEIVEDACGSYNNEMHNFSIKFMSNFSKIIRSNEI